MVEEAANIELEMGGTVESMVKSESTTETVETTHLDAPTEIINKSRSTSVFTPSTALQTQQHYRIDPKKWCGLFRGYVRQDWNTINVEDGVDELRAHWVELFFDLIYVACIVHLSSEVTDAISNKNITTCEDTRRRLASVNCEHQWKYSFILTGFAQFGLLTNAWKKQVMYVTHFVFNQWIDDVLKVLFMVSVLSMGIFMKDNETYERAFMIAYQWLNVVYILMFLKVLLIPRAKWHAIWYLIQSLVTIIFVIPIVKTFENKCAIQYFGVYLALFIFENLSTHLSWQLFRNCKPKIAIPINVPHISERFGLFIMIILGESIISVMNTNLGELDLEEKFEWKDDGSPPSQILVGFVSLTFVLSYCIARLYFDCQPNEEAILTGTDNHALRISRRTAAMYLYAHQMLFFGLLGLGMGIKITGKHLLETQRRWIDVVLPGYSLVTIIIALNIIRIAHPYNVKIKIWIFRILLLIIMFIMPLLAKTMNNGVIFLIIFICILLQLFVDFEGKEQIKIGKEEMKEKRHLAHEQHNNNDNNNNNNANLFKNMKRMRSGVGKI